MEYLIVIENEIGAEPIFMERLINKSEEYKNGYVDALKSIYSIGTNIKVERIHSM